MENRSDEFVAPFFIMDTRGERTTHHLEDIIFLLPPNFHLPHVAILIPAWVSKFLDKFNGRASGASKRRKFGAWNLRKRLWRIRERCEGRGRRLRHGVARCRVR